MHTSSAVAALVLAAQAVSAFKGTYPIVAGSSDKLAALSQLSPAASSTSRSSFNQQTFAATHDLTDDLCSLHTLSVLAAPGLHYSDLAYLPSAASSPSGLNSLLHHLAQPDNAGTTLTHPYVSAARTQAALAHPAAKLVRRFVKQCGARVEVNQPYDRNVWPGSDERENEAKVLRVVTVDRLDQLDLVGKEAREARRQIMQQLDAAFSAAPLQIDLPYAILLSSFPPAFFPTSAPSISSASSSGVVHQKRALSAGGRAAIEKLRKRQYTSEEAEEEYVEELLDEIAKEDALDDMIEKMEELEEAKEEQQQEEGGVAAPVANEEYAANADSLGVTDVVSDPDAEEAGFRDAWAIGGFEGEGLLDVTPKLQQQDGGNGTSIFQPKAGAGLLHRYVFFTPALIFSFLVTLLVLVPALLIAVQALTAVETVQGLETKMVGSVGLDPSKQ
ncbi:hypothetical protein JCM8097_003965 [Rhodosporidiobolus ruineniae]